jgi:two-component system, LytTR family, sensor kinase
MNRLIQLILKYRIFHIIYWAWVFISFLHYRQERFGGTLSSHIPIAVIIYFYQMAVIYFLLYFLVPRFLNRQKYLVFTCATIILILAGTTLSSLTFELYYYQVYKNLSNTFLIMTVSQTVDMVIVVLIFLSADIIYSRYQNDLRNRKIEKEKLETELNFLKSQLNPHFLFNALNSIYVLIEEDKKVASQTLLKFSGLLRYQLYECKENFVEVSRELEFLNDYTGLEKLRNGDNLQVKFDIPENINHFAIAPFILIPFVENAFKHVSRNPHKENYVEIESEIIHDAFIFKVSNTVDHNSLEKNKNGGIGLQNVKRRLELLYPEKHELTIFKQNGTFDVMLKLYTDKNELHHS